ncbi:hypothetical protein BDV26DRAFT_253237 [Aspergillus bertholletiae]|uniref:Uncharacterized protein n=1 Tax=Aspergillus bertholletiae TaxID=1226010 RepID=A0A5N7BM60_9EURO|nr:hypothetical protein BDV26DRAFT_253237 [Aspergillus bertholletiae]
MISLSGCKSFHFTPVQCRGCLFPAFLPLFFHFCPLLFPLFPICLDSRQRHQALHSLSGRTLPKIRSPSSNETRQCLMSLKFPHRGNEWRAKQ